MADLSNCTTGILVVNTGSPASLTKKAIGHFIGDILSDRHVMGMPNWVRNTLARRIIAPLRASSSLKKYSLIWGSADGGSPLLEHTTQLAGAIETAAGMAVEPAMRYGDPSIGQALKQLKRKSPALQKLIVFPLFPHYALTSYQTAVDEVRLVLRQHPEIKEVKIVEPFFDHPAYINALSKQIEKHAESEFDMLVFSFHSLPASHVNACSRHGLKYDYTFQTRRTAELVCEKLGVSQARCRVVYASAMGRGWLSPDLDKTMALLPAQGAKRIVVIAPGFATDNLETLYDIDICARSVFMRHGGESFVFVPCLNGSEAWAGMIARD